MTKEQLENLITDLRSQTEPNSISPDMVATILEGLNSSVLFLTDVDSKADENSTNPIQNKIYTRAVQFLSNAVSGLIESNDSLKSEVDSLQYLINSVRTNVQNNKSSIEDLQTLIDESIQEQINALKEDVQGNKDNIQNLQELIEYTISELQNI